MNFVLTLKRIMNHEITQLVSHLVLELLQIIFILFGIILSLIKIINLFYRIGTKTSEATGNKIERWLSQKPLITQLTGSAIRNLADSLTLALFCFLIMVAILTYFYFYGSNDVVALALILIGLSSGCLFAGIAGIYSAMDVDIMRKGLK